MHSVSICLAFTSVFLPAPRHTRTPLFALIIHGFRTETTLRGLMLDP